MAFRTDSELADDLDAGAEALVKSIHPSRLGRVPDADLAEAVTVATGIMTLQAHHLRARAEENGNGR